MIASFLTDTKTTHPSHKLFFDRDILVCKSCGLRAVKVLHKLTEPCRPYTSLSSHGAKCLNKLGKGLFPEGIKAWPDEQQIQEAYTISVHERLELQFKANSVDIRKVANCSSIPSGSAAHLSSLANNAASLVLA